MSLDWDFVSLEMDGTTGGECTEHVCRQHPRLTRLVQRPNRDAEWITTYHVRDVSNYYATPEAALAAMASN